MNAYRELLRKKMFEEMYDKLSPEDKRTFIQLTMEDKNWSDIAQALQRQETKIDDVSRKIGKHPFATDLFSNVIGNGITDGLIWLGRILFKKL